jgi:hypothetical protein
VNDLKISIIILLRLNLLYIRSCDARYKMAKAATCALSLHYLTSQVYLRAPRRDWNTQQKMKMDDVDIYMYYLITIYHFTCCNTFLNPWFRVTGSSTSMKHDAEGVMYPLMMVWLWHFNDCRVWFTQHVLKYHRWACAITEGNDACPA